MRTIIILTALALCGFASPRVIDSWNGGPKTPAYHHVYVDCQTLTHGFGRNAFWGRWQAPLAELTVFATPGVGANSGLRIDCQGGATCIKVGQEGTKDPVATHVIPFESPQDALKMAGAIADLRNACAG